MTGHLTSAQVGEVRRILGDSGILSTSTDSNLVVDAADEELTVRGANEVRTWAQSPGFEQTGNPLITQIRRKLMAIPLPDAALEPPEQWRRFPTPWLQ